MAGERENLKDLKSKDLEDIIEDINMKKEACETDMTEKRQECEKEEELRKAQDAQDEEKAEKERQKIQEKIDMDKAAQYIQWKWNWFQVEGKALAKKNRKGKKGGKKGKKKK